MSRVEDEVRPQPEQVGRQRDHDELRTALAGADRTRSANNV
jgi:hypothetical protein